MKENKRINSNIEKAQQKLLIERDRVDKELEKVKRRLEELRAKRRASLFGDNPIDTSVPLSIDAVENDAYKDADSVIASKIEKLQRVLKAGRMVDAEYRKAAVEYLDAIEPEVKKLNDIRSACVEEKENLIKATEKRCEELDNEVYRTQIETDDLLNAVGGSIYISDRTLGGPYVLNRLRNEIRKCEKGV